MDNYSKISKDSKVDTSTANRKKIAPVTKGKARKRNSLVDSFISEDAGSIKSYIVGDVLIPSIKKALVDIITDGISLLFYGDTSHGSRRSSSYKSSSYVSYNNYSDRFADRNRPSELRSRYSYDDIILPTRGEAEEVLTRMDELLDTYGVVSVADLYDLVDLRCDYTDNKYGWTNLAHAEAVRVSGGFMLKLPRPTPI